MARTVRDAAICLGVLNGIDPEDSKTIVSEGNFYKDYTLFLKEDGLKGKRIGLYKTPMGIHFKVDSLMNRAIKAMTTQGAEIVEIEKMPGDGAGKHSFEVMLFEYKDGLNNYFKSLGPGAPIRNIEDLIEFNKKDSIELLYFDQNYLEMAREKGDLTSPDYQSALEEMLKMRREQGIDKLMNDLSLDAIIAPTGAPAWKTDLVNGDSYNLGSSSPAAQAGYPNITVPMGFIEDLPVGISFFGRAWSEPVLIEIAYAFETLTRHRRAPEFIAGELWE
jgi:amidase